MPKYRINFFPEKSETGFSLDKVDIIEKSAYWFADVTNFATDGYVTTDDTTWANVYKGNFWIKMKPKEGYSFTDVHKTDSRDLRNEGDLTLESDGSVKIAPWENGTTTIVNNYLHMEVGEYGGLVVKQNLENCKSDAKDSYNMNEEVTITLNTYAVSSADNEWYLFITQPTITMGEQTLKFTVSDDHKSATITFTITDNITINATAVADAKQFFIQTLENCTCDIVDGHYIESFPFTFTVTANSGYELNGDIVVKEGNLTRYYFNFIEDNTKCVITISESNDITLVSAQAIPKVVKIGSFVNLYEVNDDILTELSKVRFRDYDTNKVDSGSFISSLIKIPFDVPDSMKPGTGDIKLGYYDTDIAAPILSTYKLNVDIGEITIPEKYKNAYDYMDSICTLYLPYCEKITLNTENVINQTLNIEYVVDLYSGNATVNVRSTFTNEIIESTNANVSSKIPFMQSDTNSVFGSVSNLLDNGIRTAYVEVVRSIPYNSDNLFGKPTVDYGILENYKGYIEVSDILLNISATADEKDEIRNLLTNGVFIA